MKLHRAMDYGLGIVLGVPQKGMLKAWSPGGPIENDGNFMKQGLVGNLKLWGAYTQKNFGTSPILCLIVISSLRCDHFVPSCTQIIICSHLSPSLE
jgi:hypothetical protein